MPFQYTNQNSVIYGNISIIPDKYKDQALLQKNIVIQHHGSGLFCPPVAVDIGIAIQYITN
jgi:hypothetical protein